MAPAMGVPKTEAKPALIPQMTSFLRSGRQSSTGRRKMEARPAPICAQGPSLPAEPPKARVMTVATSLTGTTMGLILPDSL